MELTHEDVEKYIEIIATASKIVDINDKTFLFKQPDAFALMKAKHIYSQEYERSVKEGLLSIDDMKKIVERRNLITEKERKHLFGLKSRLEAQKILLAKTTKVKANQDRIKNIIYDLESKIKSLESKEQSKFSMTAETRAEESKLLYLCWYCSYDFNTDNRYWVDYDIFSSESDLLLRQRILSEFVLFYSGIPTSVIRAVARNNLWRIRYITSIKTSESLFGIPSSKYSNDMLNLAYWSHYYQNVYEMMPEDQPSDDIIEDDDALDSYLKDYYNERSKDVATRRHKKRLGSSKLNAFDKDEVIITRANELYEDIEYDRPREAQVIKDRNMVKKKIRHKRSRVGYLPDNLPHK